MHRFTVWLKRLLLAFFALVVLYQVWLFAWVLWWNWANPQSTRFMEIRLAALRQSDPQAQVKQQWVDYERISPHLKRAIIAAEDARFVDHEGFDWEGIQHAIERNQKKGRVVAGGSTISQQLAKNLFLTPARTPWRKAEEALITLMLESIWSKRRILEVYLNVIEWGEGIFGAEAAGRRLPATITRRLPASFRRVRRRAWLEWYPTRVSTTATGTRRVWRARRRSFSPACRRPSFPRRSAARTRWRALR